MNSVEKIKKNREKRKCGEDTPMRSRVDRLLSPLKTPDGSDVRELPERTGENKARAKTEE